MKKKILNMLMMPMVVVGFVIVPSQSYGAAMEEEIKEAAVKEFTDLNEEEIAEIGGDLRRAADQGNLERVRNIVVRYPFPEIINAQDFHHEYTALIWAAQRGHLDVVRFLLEKGANKELSSVDGDTALNSAQEMIEIGEERGNLGVEERERYEEIVRLLR